MSEPSKNPLFSRNKTLAQEISRDPISADLLFTIFASTVGTQFYDSKAPQPKEKSVEEIVKSMPPMQQLASYSSDDEIKRAIGEEATSILHFAIIECPSAFTCLPESQEIPALRRQEPTSDQPKCFQFKVIESPPGKEEIFQAIKAKYNSSIYLWHSSTVDRWYGINKLGLVSTANNPELMRCGSVYGPGIYLTQDSTTSLGYATIYENKYLNSQLGKKIYITSIFEVVNLPNKEPANIEIDVKGKKEVLNGSLNFIDWAYHLTLSEACIARYLFVNLDAKIDLIKDKEVTDALI